MADDANAVPTLGQKIALSIELLMTSVSTGTPPSSSDLATVQGHLDDLKTADDAQFTQLGATETADIAGLVARLNAIDAADGTVSLLTARVSELEETLDELPDQISGLVNKAVAAAPAAAAPGSTSTSGLQSADAANVAQANTNAALPPGTQSDAGEIASIGQPGQADPQTGT